jgi:DNA-binding response OmpR family regulator
VGKPRHILIVEDDPDLRRLWRLALTLEGFDVTEAADGLDALRLIEEDPPALLVLDLGLPRLSGQAVRQEIAAHAVTRDLPIIVVTGSGEDLDHLSVPCVLRKPFSPEHLVQTVRSCIRTGAPGIGS